MNALAGGSIGVMSSRSAWPVPVGILGPAASEVAVGGRTCGCGGRCVDDMAELTVHASGGAGGVTVSGAGVGCREAAAADTWYCTARSLPYGDYERGSRSRSWTSTSGAASARRRTRPR